MIWEHMQLGLANALTWSNLAYCLFGVTVGTFLGVVPGIGTLAALSMLFPLTYQVGPDAALIMLAGIYYGTSYGGSTAAILLNVPGTPSSAIVCIDGYPMAQQGRAGVALFVTALSSFFATAIGIVIMMTISPLVAEVAVRFGSPDYFALILLGLIASSVIVQGAVLSGLAMVILGMLISCIGTDIYTGQMRYTFGLVELYDGVAMVAMAIGLFGIGEVIATLRQATSTKSSVSSVTMRTMMPTRDDWRRFWRPMLRGTWIGAFFGALPGTGGLIASVVSYGVEKSVAKDPSRFGNGAIEGIIAPEAANSSSDPTAYITTFTLGIPSSASMALMIGVLMIHGINPGPQMIAQHPDLFWGLVAAFWIGNLMLLVLNIPLIGLWVSVLQIPYGILYPLVTVFTCIGVFTVGGNTFDILMVAAFGLLGYLFRIFDFSSAPLILGLVLGPLMEEHFRRSMLMSQGDPSIFFQRPFSASLLGLVGLMLAWTLWRFLQRSHTKRSESLAATANR